MAIMPLWPNLQPRATDPLWFNADMPFDDESQVTMLESKHQTWVRNMNISLCALIISTKQLNMYKWTYFDDYSFRENKFECKDTITSRLAKLSVT